MQPLIEQKWVRALTFLKLDKQVEHFTSRSGEIFDSSQLVEATALALFLGDPRNSTTDSFTLDGQKPGPLHEVLDQTGIRVPGLQLYDATDHVLILSDLGPLPDLSRVFRELGGYAPGPGNTCQTSQPVPRSHRLGEQLVENEVIFFERLGRRYGSFFALLHSQRTHQLIPGASTTEDLVACPDRSSGFPSLPEMKTVVHEHVIKPLRSQLLLFPSLLRFDEAEALFSTIEACFFRDTTEQERCFVIGICWTGTVLLNPENRPENPSIGIIDWEFANVSGRGTNGDISQFIAHLELFLIAAYTQDKDVAPGHISALSAILRGFVSAYKKGRDKTEDSGLKEVIMR